MLLFFFFFSYIFCVCAHIRICDNQSGNRTFRSSLHFFCFCKNKIQFISIPHINCVSSKLTCFYLFIFLFENTKKNKKAVLFYLQSIGVGALCACCDKIQMHILAKPCVLSFCSHFQTQFRQYSQIQYAPINAQNLVQTMEADVPSKH